MAVVITQTYLCDVDLSSTERSIFHC